MLSRVLILSKNTLSIFPLPLFFSYSYSSLIFVDLDLFVTLNRANIAKMVDIEIA